MELKDSIKGLFGKKGKEKESFEIGSEFIWVIIENYHKAEKEFFEFLGALESKTADEIAELPVTDFINLVTELFSERNLPFFKSAVN